MLYFPAPTARLGNGCCDVVHSSAAPVVCAGEVAEPEAEPEAGPVAVSGAVSAWVEQPPSRTVRRQNAEIFRAPRAARGRLNGVWITPVILSRSHVGPVSVPDACGFDHIRS
jgi:hypothetical protein